MMKSSLITVILLFATLIAPFSNTARASELQLQRFLEQVQTLQAEFTQNVVDETGRRLESSSGMLYLARPGKFRWNYYDEFARSAGEADPSAQARSQQTSSQVGQQIVADGESIFMYDPDLEQVTSRSLEDAIGQVPSLLLVQPKSNLDQHFIVSDVGVTDGLSWVALKPTAEDAGYQQLMLGFNRESIAAITLLDGLGNETKLSLSGVRTNLQLDDTLFAFVVPDGADVLEN